MAKLEICVFRMIVQEKKGQITATSATELPILCRCCPSESGGFRISSGMKEGSRISAGMKEGSRITSRMAGKFQDDGKIPDHFPNDWKIPVKVRDEAQDVPINTGLSKPSENTRIC